MEKFRNLGLKLTPQRLAVLECLDGNAEHPSAEIIFDEIKKKFPTISFATVYKTLEALKAKGEILELTIDPGRRRYDPNTKAHHHIICLQCKKVNDVQGDLSIALQGEAACGYEVVGNHIEFYGYCPKCKESRRN